MWRCRRQRPLQRCIVRINATTQGAAAGSAACPSSIATAAFSARPRPPQITPRRVSYFLLEVRARGMQHVHVRISVRVSNNSMLTSQQQQEVRSRHTPYVLLTLLELPCPCQQDGAPWPLCLGSAMTSFTCSLNAWTEEVIEMLMQLVWRHARPHPSECACRCGVRAASCMRVHAPCMPGRPALKFVRSPASPYPPINPAAPSGGQNMPVRRGSDH